ncbi:hypothetical protein CPT_Mater43 [Bacillus phage Mater]|uniref:Uncharacterized protein n=1 Tax=Bacillus phage Mater TaxID=1540090 RepID=A0A0A0RMB6_9CAUD|nr:hypothetical protein CPT_Mater43 [Bacillus phage Mater]AIW03200.1 hypothetical protein CPT_Mater43 [Bacillus phage Mater]
MELYLVTELEFADDDFRDFRIIGVFDSEEAVAAAAKELGYQPKRRPYPYHNQYRSDVYVKDETSYSGFDLHLEVEELTLNDYIKRQS